MGVAEVVDAGRPAEVGGGSGGVPAVVAEPTGGNVRVVVDDAGLAGVVLALGTALGAIGGVGGSAVAALALADVVARGRAVRVGAAVRCFEGEGGGSEEFELGRLVAAAPEEEVVRGEAVGFCVGLELGDDLGAKLEAAPALALGVVLDQEATAFGVEPGDEFDDRAADGEDAGGEVEVLDTEFGQFAPAKAALDVGLDQELGGSVGEGLVDAGELLGGDDLARLLRDGVGLHPAAGVVDEDAVVDRGREDGVEDCGLAVLDAVGRGALLLEVRDPLADGL